MYLSANFILNTSNTWHLYKCIALFNYRSNQYTQNIKCQTL